VFLIHTAPEHADVVARAVVAACRGDAWPASVQPRLLHALFDRLLGRDLDFETLAPLPVDAVADALRSPEERSELVQLMCAIEVLCNPVPRDVEAGVERWARALGVEERSLVYLRDAAAGEAAKALTDFYRLNWIGDLDRRRPGFEALWARAGDAALARTVEEDPEIAARWSGLARCLEGSLGRHLSAFYDARGFAVPGRRGAANESVAQHDWIHVLADYGTTPIGELEVLSFQTTCSRTPGAMLGLIGALALFESGVMRASLVTPGVTGALSQPGGVERMTEATERGKACNADLLDVDFFAIADEPVDALRERFEIPPKSARALALDPYGAAKLPPD
jgi:hypothetical protein